MSVIVKNFNKISFMYNTGTAVTKQENPLLQLSSLESH